MAACSLVGSPLSEGTLLDLWFGNRNQGFGIFVRTDLLKDLTSERVRTVCR